MTDDVKVGVIDDVTDGVGVILDVGVFVLVTVGVTDEVTDGVTVFVGVLVGVPPGVDDIVTV